MKNLMKLSTREISSNSRPYLHTLETMVVNNQLSRAQRAKIELITCIGLALAYKGLAPALSGKRVKSRVRIKLIVDNYARDPGVHIVEPQTRFV